MSTNGHLRSTKGHLGATVGQGLRVTIGHLRSTIGHPGATIGHLRSTKSIGQLSGLRVTTGYL